VHPPVLARERAWQKLADGVPLLHLEVVDFDPAYCRELLATILSLESDSHSDSVPATAIRAAVASGKLDLDRAFGEALADHADHLAELAAWAGLDLEPLGAALRLAVTPSLRAHAAALAPLLQQPERWQRGYCPVCGSWPSLALLEPATPPRHLQCARCSTRWAVVDRFCVYCGNDVPDAMSIPELGVAVGLETCGHCRGYLKTVLSINDPRSVDDCALAGLDRRAFELGFRRVPAAGFRLELAELEPDEGLEDLLEAD
jgi:FdhE protein